VTKESLFAAFFFAVFLFLLYQLFLFLAPFATPLILAGVLAITFSPATARVKHLVGGSRSLTATLMSVAVIVIVLVPGFLMLSLLVNEAQSVYEIVEGKVSANDPAKVLGDTWATLTARFEFLSTIDVTSLAVEASKRVSRFVASETTALARDLLVSAFNLMMMMIALWFFFRDGDRIARVIDELIPMEAHYKARIEKLVYDALIGVMQSSMLIAVLQGVLSGLAYWLIGGLAVNVLLGFMTGVASLIPLGGATLVWLPTAVFLMIMGEIGRGIGMVVFGVLVISSVDNFVRPLVIGGRIEIPTLLLLFALVGGLTVYGFLGIFLAPVVLAMLLAFVAIYRETYVAPRDAPEPAVD
jgi:predicted PurR-regulated permease PerM